jgi:hypothetical protein
MRLLADQRGVALPMAMLALIILSALVIGFSVLSASEPTIANNQLMVAQARSLAEAGVERAMWALQKGFLVPTDPNGIPTSLTGTAPPPYDGSQLLFVSTGGNTIGGFRVTVVATSNLERTIIAVGWVPNDTTTNPKAHQKITVKAVFPSAFPPPPAALSVRGDLEAGGNSLVDSRADTSCGAKPGSLTTGATSINSGAADIYGSQTGTDQTTANQILNADGGAIPASPSDIVENVATTLPPGTPGNVFDQYLLTDADINALRTYAKAHGTYLQGSVTFDASNKIPNGLVFVDTVSGNDITQEGVTPATPTSDFASVEIHGNPPADPSGVFSGWLFVNGTLAIDGNFVTHGLLYAQNDVTYHGVGTGGVYGAVMSRNIRDLSSTSIDSDLLGNALINYNCAWARMGGGMFQTWNFEPGTYKEVSD